MTATAATPAPLSVVNKLRLAAEILSAYGRVRWSLRREKLPRVVAALRDSGSGRASALPLPDAARDGQRLGAAVVRALSPIPSASRCLMRSLVLLDLLARRGAHGELVIAVQPSGQSPLDAHAWVEVDGRPLLAPAPAYGRLITL
jgi:Transglutaminase-like superfamily